jgi:RimJ/RimL family protein N-acetyltransferase
MFLDAGSIVLRPAEERDRESLIAVLMNADVMRFALEERPLTRSEAETLVRTQFAVGDEVLGMHSISVDSTGAPVGFGGYRRCTLLGVDDVEFGWVIAKHHQGLGYATALGRALIRHALDTLTLNRVLAACNPSNGPSEHILRDKLKMRFEGEVEPRPAFRRRVYSAVSDGGGHQTG